MTRTFPKPEHLLFFLVLFFTVAVNAQTNLNVTNGSKNIGKARERRAQIWSDPNPPSMVFDRWTGDTALVEDVFAAHTFVNPLGKNISLTANYKPAPNWSLTETAVNGVSVLYYIPPDPTGIIFRFHGSGGSNQSVLLSVESRLLSNDAVAEGYGIVAINSADRINGDWNLSPPPNNPDLTNVQAVIEQFRKLGLISDSVPLLAQGTSRGGVFSSEAVYHLNFSADAIYIAYGVNVVMPITTVPTIFCLAANDDQEMVGPEGNQRAYEQFVNLQNRGIRSGYNLNQPSPVYPERFWRIADLTADDSRAIYQALKQNNFLDSRDLLIENPRDTDWRSVIPAKYTPYLNAISSQLGACYASHNFYSDYNSRVLRFFAEVLSDPQKRRK